VGFYGGKKINEAIIKLEIAAQAIPVKVKIKDHGDWISATLKKDGYTHSWRLIRHETIKQQGDTNHGAQAK